MKTTILITLLMMLIPSAVIGQNELQSVLSYNKADSTLTVMVRNNSTKSIMIRSQSKHIPSAGSIVQLGYRNKNGSVGYHTVGLGSDFGGLWSDFLVISPGIIKYGTYNSSIKFYLGDRTFVSADIHVSYCYRDSSGELIRFYHTNSKTFE